MGGGLLWAGRGTLDVAVLALKLLALLLICCVAPGLFVVSRLRWSPLEKLCGAMAASFIVTYLAALALFCLNAPPIAYWLVTGIFAVMGISAWRTARLLVRRRPSRAALLAFAAMLCWCYLHVAMVRHYGGGDWSGDWREHFERTQYFLHVFPKEFYFVGEYRLPARPPLMNLIAAFICAQAGLDFPNYQFTFVFLNAWTIIPCCLFLHLLAPRQRRLVPILLGLYMLNPSIMENATLTVTKAMTAGMVVLGVCMYRRNRLVPAGLALTAAVLTHYSAAPFAIAIAVWHVASGGIKRWKQSLQAAGAALLLAATWFGYAIYTFGLRLTFAAPTGTTGMADTSLAENLHRIAYNLFTSIVPHPLHPVDKVNFTPIDQLGKLRDYYFLMSQTTMLLMIGLAGGVVAVGLWIWCLRRLPGQRRFWLFYVVFSYIVGISVNYDWNPFGCAHITMQSLAMMGVVLLAWRFRTLPIAIRGLVVIGAIVDYGLGIWLHFDRQSYVHTMLRAGDKVTFAHDLSLGGGFQDYIAKMAKEYVFWGDWLAPAAPVLRFVTVFGALVALSLVLTRPPEPRVE